MDGWVTKNLVNNDSDLYNLYISIIYIYHSPPPQDPLTLELSWTDALETVASVLPAWSESNLSAASLVITSVSL